MALDGLLVGAAIDVRDLVAQRQLSAVEVVEATLERIARVNPALNAVVTLDPRALDTARALDERLSRGEAPGLLCGLPVGIKDVTPVGGLRTTYGSPLFRDHVPDGDALVVERLRAAGAIVIGKTNTPEFAAGGNTFNDVFGRTRNPWDPALSAGGSTGGGAASLATGMIALAEGTDLGGSLRIPASFCGVVGLRPSVGLVPTHPIDYVWDTLQVTGPMARTATDVALMLQAIAGPSPFAPLAQPVEGRDFVAAARREGLTGRRLAYCADFAGIGIEPSIERACRTAAFDLAEEGALVEEVALDLSAARATFLSLRGHWFATMMHPLRERLDALGVNVANNVRAGLAADAGVLAAAEHARGALWHAFRDLFERFDHLLAPCMAVPPFPVERNYPDTVAGRAMATYVDWLAPTFILSLTGLPVACVPAGVDGGGMPVGLQIVGRPRDEEGVLAAASAVQRAHPVGVPDASRYLGQRTPDATPP
jgi:amidase